MPCRRRMGGKRAQHLLARLQAAIGVTLAEHSLVAWLVPRRGEEELAGLGKRIGEIADRPSGKNASEVGDVLLAVAAADTQRVQLQNFAREILVEAEAAVHTRPAVGTDGHLIVEID